MQPGSSLAYYSQYGQLLGQGHAAPHDPMGAGLGGVGSLPPAPPAPPQPLPADVPPLQLYRSLVENPPAPAAQRRPAGVPKVAPPPGARRWRGAFETNSAEGADGVKPRVRWTPILRAQFDTAVAQLGGLQLAQPAQILTLMRAAHPEAPAVLPGVAPEDAPIVASQMKLSHVKSHLQKCRLVASNPGGVPRRLCPRVPAAEPAPAPAKRPGESGAGIWHLLAAVAPEKARVDALDAAPAAPAEYEEEAPDEESPGGERAEDDSTPNPNKRARVVRKPSRLED